MVTHGPVSAVLHLVTSCVCLVLGLRDLVTLRWQRTPIVFRVFTMVTRVAGYVRPTLLLRRPDFTMLQVLLHVPCATMAISGMAVL